MPAPQIVAELVERFAANLDAYRSGAYKEYQLRQEFINPFFKALGWDVDNERGYAEAYKEVIHEDALKIGGATKAPDYCFRIGGTRKFFVEAKKPSVDIAGETSPAYQLRRYAWSAKLPLSILTDFEELAVYDTRVKPARTDKASTARVKYITYTEYASRWDEIAAIFARDAILKGSFDKYAAGKGGRRGTDEVDNAFLAEIETWRNDLARVIALRNPALSQRDLNFVVQATVDRIIFLRICEDRGIEPYGRLQSLLNSDRVYPRLFELFERADERYNSGLFHFAPEHGRTEAPDTLSRTLDIDDKVLRDILRRLYYPDSPYEFSVLPADILGQVYEQFLGKVIRLTAGHRAVVEEKPEVRKAGGVYYTPTYIVDYIVAHTLGPLLGVPPQSSSSSSSSSSSNSSLAPLNSESGKRLDDDDEDDDENEKPGRIGSGGCATRTITPKQAARLRILDPACGSGSFLLGAYQYLLDWHLAWYTAHDPEKHAKGRNPALYQVAAPSAFSSNPQSAIRNPQSSWRLTLAERKRILLNNIHGVDIDTQAVEVTKLSLLLKVLEGASREVLDQQLKLFHDRALPDLASNIKCGNSLIGYDIRQGQLTLFDEEESLRINMFEWSEAFPAIMGHGGFDAVIGNPPYIRIQTLKEWAPVEVEYYKRRYTAASRGNYDIYVVFVERGLSLLNPKGRLGMILPSKFLSTDYGAQLRGHLADGAAVDEIIDFGHAQVFDQVTTYTCLLFLDRAGCRQVSYLRVVPQQLSTPPTAPEAYQTEPLGSEPWVFAGAAAIALLDKLHQHGMPLLDLPAAMCRGSSTGADDVFCLVESAAGLSTRDGERVQIERAVLRRPLYASDFTRYSFRPRNTEKVIFPYESSPKGLRLIDEADLATRFPKAYEYLRARRKALQSRKQGGAWYGFSAPRSLDAHDQAHLIVPLLADRGLAAPLPQEGERFCVMASAGFSLTLGGVRPAVHPLYVLAIVNSKLLFWNLRQISNKFRGGWITCTKQYFGRLPVHLAVKTDHGDRGRHDLAVGLVEQMLSRHKAFSSARTAHEQTAIQRQIEATDRDIDQLVYELYGLTEEEIGLVEEVGLP